MITETIEWFTLEEKVPDVDECIFMKFTTFVAYGCRDWDGDYVSNGGFVMTPPLHWAYMPKGPTE